MTVQKTTGWRDWPGVWRLRFAFGFLLLAVICLTLPRRHIGEGVGFIAERFERLKGFTA
jgi:hypothetical protein